MIERAAHVAARIAILEAAHQDPIQRCSRHHTELTGLRNRPRQSPIGYANTHPALNHGRQLQLRELFHQQNTILCTSGLDRHNSIITGLNELNFTPAALMLLTMIPDKEVRVGHPHPTRTPASAIQPARRAAIS